MVVTRVMAVLEATQLVSSQLLFAFSFIMSDL